MIITLVLSIWYVYRYVSKVEKDPSKSAVFEQRQEDLDRFSVADADEGGTMTGRQKGVLTPLA